MDQLVVVNPSFIPKLEAYGISKDKITYIPNFVSAEMFHPASTIKNDFAEQYHYPKKFTILGSGQVQVRKGFWLYWISETASRNAVYLDRRLFIRPDHWWLRKIEAGGR